MCCCRDQNIESLLLIPHYWHTHTHAHSTKHGFYRRRRHYGNHSKHTARSKNNHQQTNTECTIHFFFFFVFASAPQRDGSLLTGLGWLFPSSSSEFLVPLSHFLFTAQNSHFLSAAILLCAFALDRRPLWLFAFRAILDF